MPRDGAIIFGDLIDELGMQRIECAKRDPIDSTPRRRKRTLRRSRRHRKAPGPISELQLFRPIGTQ